MNNSESLSEQDLDRVARAASGHKPMPVPKASYDNPKGTPPLTLSVDEHDERISSLAETVERLINRLAPVVDYPRPEPTAASSGLPPPQSPTPKLYERIQSNTERLVRLERKLNDIHERLTV